MTGMEAVPDGIDLAQGEAALALAAAQLRTLPPPTRVVAVADRVLERALAAPRRAVLVDTDHDDLRVSSVAIVALLREALDTGLTDAAVRRVTLDVGPDAVLAGVRVELVVRYLSSVPDIADRATALTLATLTDVLGDSPAPGAADLVPHVHVGDVTLGDPRLVDPIDEGLDPA